MIDKQVKTTAEAVAGVRDGSTVLVAGFGAVGVADNLLDALHEQGARELTIVANNSGNGDYGLARLINSGRARKVICSYPGSGDYSATLNAYRARTLEPELLPQGAISERMRCHAAGLGGFFSPTPRHKFTAFYSFYPRFPLWIGNLAFPVSLLFEGRRGFGWECLSMSGHNQDS